MDNDTNIDNQNKTTDDDLKSTSQTDSSKFIKELINEELLKEETLEEYDKYYEENYEKYQKLNLTLKKIDKRILELLDERLKNPDNGFHYKLQRLLNGESFKDITKDSPENEETDNKILYLIETRLKSKDTLLRGKIQKKLENNEYDKDVQYKEYESIYNKTMDIVDEGSNFENEDKSLKLEKIFNNEKHILDEITEDNEILESIQKGLELDDYRINDKIQKIIDGNNKKTEITRKLPLDFKKNSIIALLIYAEIKGVTDYKKLSKCCETNEDFKYIMDEEIPSEAMLQETLLYYGYVFEFLNISLVSMINERQNNDFNTVSFNATIKDNENYVIESSDIKKILNNIPKTSKKKTASISNKLNLASQTILTNNNMTKNEKLEYTRFLKKELKKADKKKLKLNSDDVTYILGKKKEIEIAYNQKTSDKKSNLITNIEIEPSLININDYRIEIITEDLKRHERIDLKDYLTDKKNSIKQSTDTQEYYESNSYLDYLSENNNDDFLYDFKTDTFKSHNNKKLELTRIITEKSSKNEDNDTIKKIYNDTDSESEVRERIDNEAVRELIDFKEDITKQSHTLSENRIQIENQLQLKILAYNIKRLINYENSVKEKDDTLETFIHQLTDDFEDIDFKITKFE